MAKKDMKTKESGAGDEKKPQGKAGTGTADPGKEPEVQEKEAGQDPAADSAETEEQQAEAGEAADPVKAQIDELKDKVLRQAAEFDNFRKRTEREKSQMFDTGAAHVIEKILPVVDNFERGLATAPDADKEGSFAEGMNMIYKQMVKALADLGVTPIEALGKEFDPAFHNAVMQTPATDEYPSGTVAQELQKGYMYRETVIRHSMVAVSE